MMTMRARLIGAALVAAALGAVGCDPFLKEDTSAPYIQRLVAFDGSFSAAYEPLVVEVSGTPSPYTLAPVETKDNCLQPLAFARNVVAIEFNKPMDGASIQASPGDCTPAAGALTVTPAVTATAGAWYTCYYPSAAVVGTGASIWVAWTPDQTNFGAAALDAVTNYHITGTVRDQQGTSLGVDVTVTTTADPAPPTLSSPSAGTVDVTWTAATGASTYTVLRAPNVSGSPGTFANVTGCVGITTTSCTDTGLTSGTTYWYRVDVTGTNTYVVESCAQSITAL